MSLGKLWIRVKGELLTLKEDLVSQQDLGERTEALLTKLEGLVAGPSTPTRNEGRLEDRAQIIAQRIQSLGPAEKADARSHQELLESYEELRALKAAAAAGVSTEDTPSSPNPRRLG